MIKITEFLQNNIDSSFMEIDLKKIKKEFEKLEVSKVNSFSDMKWKINSEFKPDRYKYLDFNRIRPYVSQYFINKVKEWLIYLLMNNEMQTVASYYSHLAIFIKVSKGFSLGYIETIENHLLNTTALSPFKNEYFLVRHVIDFIEFSNLKIEGGYMALLQEAKEVYKYIRRNRVLPKSSSIMTFSYYLEKYFDEIISNCEENNNKLIIYYPVLLWWKITLIIPMRISEFCYMSRDCFYEESGKYFIRFQRHKPPWNIENIEINSEIFNMIKHYTLLTDGYKTKTLISYLATINAKGKNYLTKIKNDTDYYNSDNFISLLREFYVNVIENKYSIYFDDEEKILPNDTRHLSFISLMMQGYDPHLISRLGGHTTIEKQYEYSYHPEFWIDNQMYQLKRKMDFNRLNSVNLSEIDSSIMTKSLSRGTTDFKGELEIGFCSDKQQRCESLSSCLFCSHWRIEYDELQVRKKEIMLQINQQKSTLIELVTTYLDMIKKLYKENEVSKNDNINMLPRTLKNKIDSEIQKLYKLNSILEVDGERNR